MIGGEDGYGFELNKVECYNIEKNIWQWLPSTNKKHGNFPVVWQEIGQHLLCVGSLTANAIECIDLRQHDKKWNVVGLKGKDKWNVTDSFYSNAVDPKAWKGGSVHKFRLLK